MREPFDNQLDGSSASKRVELARSRDFTIGSVNVRPSMRTIAGPLGTIMLEPKVMQVMVALGDAGGASNRAMI